MKVFTAAVKENLVIETDPSTCLSVFSSLPRQQFNASLSENYSHERINSPVSEDSNLLPGTARVLRTVSL